MPHLRAGGLIIARQVQGLGIMAGGAEDGVATLVLRHQAGLPKASWRIRIFSRKRIVGLRLVLKSVGARGGEPGGGEASLAVTPLDHENGGLVAGGAVHLAGGRHHDIQEGTRQIG